jgi:hypothetical protein
LSTIIVYHFFFYCFTKKLHSSLYLFYIYFIFISGGQVVVVSTDFDFTLLYKLIRNLITAIPAPTCGWGNQPLQGHLNETDDIERIRHLRNNLAHNSDVEICDTEFSTHWIDLSQVENITITILCPFVDLSQVKYRIWPYIIRTHFGS